MRIVMNCRLAFVLRLPYVSQPEFWIYRIFGRSAILKKFFRIVRLRPQIH